MSSKLEVDKVYTPSPPHLDEIPHFHESLSFTPVVDVEGDGVLVNVENRKCYSQELFYTFHNRIDLQMMSLWLTKINGS